MKEIVLMLKSFHSTYSATVNSAYILSAVRTPVGLVNGSLKEVSDFHLSAVALKEASNRAKVPLEDIHNIFLGCIGQDKLNEESGEQLFQVSGLAKKSPLTLVPCGLRSVILATEYLSTVDEGVSVAGGVELMSNNFMNKACRKQIIPLNKADKEEEIEKKFSKFSKEERSAYVSQSQETLRNLIITKPFEDELIRVLLRIEGRRKTIRQDDVLSGYLLEKNKKNESRFTSVPGDGASILIIATKNYVKKNNLTPLAKIVSVSKDSLNSSNFLSMKTIHNALASCNIEPHDISQWEIDDYFCDLGLSAMKEYNIKPSFLNKDGGTLILGNPVGMSGARLICHLAHSLDSHKFGVASSNNPCGISSTVVIKKLDAEKHPLPKIVMYSKTHCPLCEKIKEQLKSLSKVVDFEEVLIEKLENEKFRKLFGWDIPVLFMNGRYLCKYTLNFELLQRRLSQIGIALSR